MQIWQNNNKGDDKIIAFFNQSLYKANPKDSEIENLIWELKTKSGSQKHGLEIPLRYMKVISLQEGKNYFEVHFGIDSTEHFKVSDESKRLEIFDYLKNNLPVQSNVITYSGFQAAKKPFTALVILILLFLWSLYLAINIESGTDYEVEGSQGSIARIILFLGYLGTRNVILIFGVLIAIAAIAFGRKYKNPPTVHSLFIVKQN